MESEISQVVILAGGKGTRIAEESETRPKPLIEIGGRPIIWHIMRHYSYYGKNRFLILAGHKGHQIKEYFLSHHTRMNNLEIDTSSGEHRPVGNSNTDNWKVTVLDTGEDTMTGGRLLAARDFLDETFHLTYGDGLSSIDLLDLEKFHFSNNTTATLSAVLPAGRFGALVLSESGNLVQEFSEKPAGDGSFVNGGFFILKKSILELIAGPETILERHPLEELANRHQLSAFLHRGFWQPMDTLRDRTLLNQIWESGSAEWRV